MQLKIFFSKFIKKINNIKKIKILLAKILLIISFLIIFYFLIIIFLIPKIFPIEIKNINNSQIFLDINGETIGEQIFDKKTRHQKTKISKTPQFLIDAIIKMEDKNFYSNNGIDYFAIIRAAKNNFLEGKIIEGGSTISSQVIRNYLWLNEKRNFSKKISEFIYAVSLNKKYSKNEILDFYLNGIYFGYLNFGFESAANFYFGKNLENLTKAEQIALLVIPKNSNKYNPFNKADLKDANNSDYLNHFNIRYQKILNFLNQNNLNKNGEKKFFPNEGNFILTKNEKLFFNKGKNKESVNMYIQDFLNKNINNKNKTINTTFDLQLSKEIEKIGLSVIQNLEWKNVGDFSVIIADKKTNELKVLIGGKSFFGKNGEVNSALAKRQVGSTLKPFIYALNYENFGGNSESKILDIPTQFKTKENYSYEPKNYSLKYKGEVSLGEALSQSINIPAIKLLEKIGVGNFMNFLDNIGIKLDKSPDFYGLSIGLGSGEISLFNLVQAYSIFTKNGNYCEFKFLKNKEKTNEKLENKICKKIISKKSSDEIIKILSDSKIKLDGFPVNSNLDFGDKKIFVKTGTSRNFRDNYAIGFNKNFLIGVWAGNKNGSEMKGVSGATGAGKIFKNIILHLEKRYGKNENIYINKKKFGEEFGKKNINNKKLKITSPISGSIFQINKNIDLEKQKIEIKFFENLKNNEKIEKNLEKKYFLNGKELFGKFINLKNLEKNSKNHFEIIFYQNSSEIFKDESIFFIE